VRSVFAIFALSACAPTAPPYAACEVQEDCAMPESEGCFELRFARTDGTEAMGAMCTSECATDADCVEPGVCITLEGDASMTFFCAQACVDPDDCYAGLRCTAVTGATRTMQLCLP
jgi:hypothetical protein